AVPAGTRIGADMTARNADPDQPAGCRPKDAEGAGPQIGDHGITRPDGEPAIVLTDQAGTGRVDAEEQIVGGITRSRFPALPDGGERSGEQGRAGEAPFDQIDVGGLSA